MRTPIDQLSLIAPPTRELFVDKLDSFDLVIFDRYSERGVLPFVYFENIARYVQNGGALLISSGPEFASPTSIFRTPLAAVLPAQPTGDVVQQPFKPLVTAQGEAHPVTRGLQAENDGSKPPLWGRWFRIIGREQGRGRNVDVGTGRQAVAGSRSGRQGPGGGNPVRSRMAVGTRFRRRRPADRIAAPACPLADEGARTRRRAPLHVDREWQARRRAAIDVGAPQSPSLSLPFGQKRSRSSSKNRSPDSGMEAPRPTSSAFIGPATAR